MTSIRHDRTLRLLASELEVVALAGEHSSARPCDLDAHVLRLAVATRNAVVLGVISADEADRIWATAVDRHPRIGSSRFAKSLAA